MEPKKHNEFIERLIVKDKNNELLSFGEASALSSYKQSQKIKLDFTGVKVIRKEKNEDFEER